MIILVPSCDAYADAWPGFMGCLQHFWPSHPRVVIMGGTRHGAVTPAHDLQVEDDDGPRSWIHRLTVALRRMLTWTQEEVLLMQEDFFLSAAVDEVAIGRACQAVSEHEVACARLFPCPGADDGPCLWPTGFGLVTPEAPYRISCQAAIWSPSKLLGLLRTLLQGDGGAGFGTAADFELRGTELSRTMDQLKIIAWRRELEPWPIQYICSAINRGKWNPDAIALCEQLGLGLDTSRRPIDGRP